MAADDEVETVVGEREQPVAQIDASPTNGQAPLAVSFDGTGSSHPDGKEFTYAWDLDGDGETDATDAQVSRTFTENGLAHDLSPADYERISTPDFAPESMPEGIEYGDTDVDEPFSHVEWY